MSLVKKNIAIVGAGLVGSLLSIYLSKRGYSVSIFEGRSDMRKDRIQAGRSINLALSDRGRKALRQVGLEEKILSISVPVYKRLMHSKKNELTEQFYGKKGQAIFSVPRRELNCMLMDLAEDTKNEIKENILKAKRRKDDYSLFKKKNYTFYPIKIRLTAAFDDGSSNPYEYYEKPDFDFNNKKQFKYNIKGDLNLSKHDENKIVLEGASENFEFSVTGFGNDCEEKVLINHQWEAM